MLRDEPCMPYAVWNERAPEYESPLEYGCKAMVERPFSYDIAVLLCSECGAIVNGPAAGGNVSCPSCGATNAFRRRQTTLAPPQGLSPSTQNPALRAQDGRPLRPPPGIAFLWEGGEIPIHRQNEAFIAWQGARRRAAQGEAAAGEELVMLGRALASSAEDGGDRLRARALLESSLQGAPFPRHRAVLLGALVRGAVRASETQEALRWWQHFESTAQDLESDSEWRLSTAVVATARDDFTAVLDALGSTFAQYAIQDALDPQALLFRANALEKSGQLAAARGQLHRLLNQGGPAARIALERMVASYAPLALCSLALAQVIAEREQIGAAMAGVGKILMGATLLSIPLISAFFGVALGIASLSPGREPSATADPMPLVVAIGIGLVLFLGFGPWGIRTLATGLRERRAFQRGVRSTARVLGARPTGVHINDMPEMLIELEVALQPPVRSTLKRVVHPGEVHVLAPGAEIHVRVDPKDPSTATLDQ